MKIDYIELGIALDDFRDVTIVPATFMFIVLYLLLFWYIHEISNLFGEAMVEACDECSLNWLPWRH